jgi:2-succinyl-5-enolpyruvyl-6-hydroxy-3-cyclohexene-1-carboxylate synthase
MAYDTKGPGSAGSPTFAGRPATSVLKKPGLMERLLSGLFPVDPAVAENVDPSLISSARKRGLLNAGIAMMQAGGPVVGKPAPNFLQALGTGLQAGVEGHDKALGSGMEMAQFVRQEQERQQRQAMRASIQQRYPAKPNETFIQRLERMQAMLPEFIATNDKEMVTSIVELLKPYSSLFESPEMDVRATDTGDGPGAERVLYDAKTGKVTGRMPMSVKPKDTTAQDNIQQQRLFQREAQLARDYSTMARQFGPVAEYYANAQASRSQALAGDAIAQHSLVFNYMHVLEPTSIVREGEYAAVAARNGAPQWLVNQLDKFKQGTFLPHDQVRKILAELDRLVAAKQPLLQRRMLDFRRRAERWGVDPANIIFDPFEGQQTPAGQTTPQAPVPNVPDLRTLRQ